MADSKRHPRLIGLIERLSFVDYAQTIVGQFLIDLGKPSLKIISPHK